MNISKASFAGKQQLGTRTDWFVEVSQTKATVSMAINDQIQLLSTNLTLKCPLDRITAAQQAMLNH